MKIYFMKQKALDSLQAEVADNLNKYQSSSFWMDEHFINQNMPKYYFDTGIEVADYQLISGEPETDFQNAKIVFEAFKNKLNPVQASDLRLWAYLAMFSIGNICLTVGKLIYQTKKMMRDPKRGKNHLVKK